MEKEVIISAKHLKKTFGSGESEQIVYSDFDIDIYKGDFTVIMGASGAGKSTLLYSLSGMDKPGAGTITFCGMEITGMNSDELAVFRRKNCGFVFQQIYLIDKMSLMDNVITAGSLTIQKQRFLHCAKHSYVSKTDIVNRANELFDMVNIPPATRKKLPSHISGGEAQRAGIVRAAINSPAAIFADEPTGALNSHNSDAVLDVFSMLNAAGQSIVMVTHDKKSALRGNRVVYIKDGILYGDCELGAYSANDKERNKKLENFLLEMEW